jgi:AcrR family transcriptional regulator
MAVAVVSEQGSAELSIRNLAALLNVSPMALYRHVENKEDLLDEVVSRLLAERWRPTSAEDDWRSWIIEAADRLRRFLVEVPAALHVYLRRPVVSPTALQRMDTCLRVLSSGLDDDARARSAYAAIQTYTIGFAALEASRQSPAAAAADGDPVVGGEGSARLRELASYASPTQFRAGLEYLLRGIADDAAE